jgi:hypothetical protein
VLGRGGAGICEPVEGEVVAGPLYDGEGIVIADCDLRAALRAKRWFDAVGHYSREDALLGRAGMAPPPRAGGDEMTPVGSRTREETARGE